MARISSSERSAKREQCHSSARAVTRTSASLPAGVGVSSGEDRWSGFTMRSISPSATRSLATRWTFCRLTPRCRASRKGRERLLGHGTPCNYHRA
ncbi:hypothetical protein ADL08_10870 [Streptomyces sp. NRRL F-6492]|nr:hypothetical protein ADL08_10870 [Streptomyces sp. NRRL F-6492]